MTLPIEEAWENATQSWPWGRAANGCYIPTHLSICPWKLLIVIADLILIRYCLLQNLKEVVGS